jgi:hypothetical protein
MWPANYSTAAMSMLRELARRNLTKMLADPLYPVDPSMRTSLTASSSVVSTLRSDSNDPSSRAKALIIRTNALAARRGAGSA